MSVHSAVALSIILPFAAAIAGMASGRRRRGLSAWISVGSTGIALLLLLGAGGAVWAGGGGVRSWVSFPTGWIPVEVAVRADPLGLTMAVLVGAVALGVQVYSASYLGEDPRYGAFTAVVSLLTAAMLVVVLAEDLVVLLAGWLLLSVFSALLVGHQRDGAEAGRAAVRAFVVPYLGDAGLLIGFFVLARQAGSFQVSGVMAAAEPSTALTVAMVLVLCGVVGKSAQVPLHVWLPGSSAGPVPAAALINSATTVAAGAFLVARLYDAFLLAPVALAVLAVVGAVTMVFAAAAAVAQEDLTRVLAWSTVSQLGFVLGGLAVGGYAAGLFHLVGHAAFKALLFLAAGSVAYAVGSTLLARLGGLAGSMRSTYLGATIGFGALAGVPPLAGSFSGHSVLAAAESAANDGGPLPVWAAGLVLAAGLLTTLLTAAYAVRAWLLTFHGPPAADGQRLPSAMRLPVAGLSAAVVGLGALGLVADGAFVRGVGEHAPGLGLHWATSLLSLALLVGGGCAAYSAWIRQAQHDPAAVLGEPTRRVLAAGFHLDEFYDASVVRPIYALSRLAGAADRVVLHPYVDAAGRATRALGLIPEAAQSGRPRSYLTALLAFVVVLALTGAVVTLV